MLVDSDVLIWFLNGNKKAQNYLDNVSFKMSAVSYIELMQDLKDKKEYDKIQKQFKMWGM